MHKILTIIRREYLTRVRTRAFIISTLLVPVGFIVMIGLSVLSVVMKEEENFRVFVKDESGLLASHLSKSTGAITYETTKEPPSLLKNRLARGEGILIIPSDVYVESPAIKLLSKEPVSINVESAISDSVTAIIRELKLAKAGISPAQLQVVNESIRLETQKISDAGENIRTSSGLAAVIGYVMGFVIYVFMFVYGAIVMRGVIEEKTSRIVEVIVSSVRPFQLMIGKIIGIAAVGLTQFSIWILLIIFLSAAGGAAAANLFEVPAAAGELGSMQGQRELQQDEMQMLVAGLSGINPSLVFYFFFYFLGGYLLYGSLFAAIGSAVDQESDTQQLMFPITMPLIIPMIFLTNILQNPNGSIALFFSLFPLTSPMTMLVRMASVEVPAWEIALSMLLLIAGFLGSVWMAGRIYRVGIFMYGKKPSFREIGKWIFVRV